MEEFLKAVMLPLTGTECSRLDSELLAPGYWKDWTQYGNHQMRQC